LDEQTLVKLSEKISIIRIALAEALRKFYLFFVIWLKPCLHCFSSPRVKTRGNS